MPTIRVHSLATGEIIDREALPHEIVHATREDVSNERDHRMRRMEYLGRTWQTDAASLRRIESARVRAETAVAAGAAAGDLTWDGAASFAWYDAGNQPMPMDAPTMLSFGDAAARWESLHMQAAQRLKALSPVPDDFRDARHWPVEVGILPARAPVTEAALVVMAAEVDKLKAAIAKLREAGLALPD